MAVLVWDASGLHHAARADRLDMLGSLWVIAGGVRSGALGELAADGLADALVREGARYPFPIRGFSRWARACGVI